MVALQRPELLGVALYEVGQPDEIRGAQQDPTAARNIAEIGDLDTDTGIRLLLKSSPYHQVPATLPLPAMLLHSASEDYNFGNEMLVGKYVARLQAANSGTRPIVWARTPGGHSDLFYVSPGWAATAMSFLLWQTGHPRFQPAPLPPK
jgi:prolyl oligopeptidase